MSTPAAALHPTAPFSRVLQIQDPDVPLVLRASDHQAVPLQWLWPGRIPLGCITLLAGDPGAGKSLFALDLAARVSTGAPFPDEPSTACENPQSAIPNPQSPSSGSSFSTLDSRRAASVLLLSATDQFHDTILPRLAAAGADASRVYVLDNLTNLRAEMEQLRATIADIPDLKLLVIDPINFYVGPGDAHFQTVVRSVLQPLAALARARNFAILAVTHFRKNDGAAIQRAAGSMGFVATARAIWTITQDPDDPSRRYFVPLKNNLTEPSTPLAFQIINPQSAIPNPQSPLTPDTEHLTSPSAPHLHWSPAAACQSAPSSWSRGGLAPLPHSPRTSTAREEARRFLEQALADGPRPAAELIDEADARGLTRRTVQRAFHDLAGHSAKHGYRAGWWWSLGEYPIDPIPDHPYETLLDEHVTYAADVAARVSAEQMHAEIERRFTELAEQHTEDVSPSPPVSPSQQSREKPPSPSDHNLSPSAKPAPDLSPSRGHKPLPSSQLPPRPSQNHPRTNPQSRIRNPQSILSILNTLHSTNPPLPTAHSPPY